MSKCQLFVKKKRDHRIIVALSLRVSIAKKLQEEANKANISRSKLVDLILANYYKQ